MGDSVPRWPGTDVPIIHAKAGDVLVHLGAILAFWSTRLGASSVGLPLVILLTANVAMNGPQNRGGLLAFLTGFLICMLARPYARVPRLILAMATCGLVILAVTNARIEVPGSTRTISFEQFINNVASISSESKATDLDGTKQWRMDWWATIVNYTFNGNYFWEGKGFGINLAVDDGFLYGFQGSDTMLLRSPHNGHLMILARAGVPGLLLWGLTHLGWAFAILRLHVKSRQRHHDDWSGLFLVLLVYWLGFMINAAFDVYIEGPMGGIWYWSIYGIGLASMWIYCKNPAMPLREQYREIPYR